MKTFLTYLFENATNAIIEAEFKKADFIDKPEDAYFKQVIELIQTNSYIVVGSNKENSYQVDIPDTLKQQILSYAANIKDITRPTEKDLDAFNTFLSKLPPIKTNSGKLTPISWTKLYKGRFSEYGKNLKGGQTAKKAEAATAYCFNVFVGNTKVTEAENNEIETKINTKLSNEGFDSNYIESSKLSAKKIISNIKNPKTMEAAHVDGNDLDSIDTNVRKVAKIFHSKEEIAQILTGIVDTDIINALYGKEKDDWNKADIVIVDKKLDIVKAAKQWKIKNGFNTIESFNEFLNSLIIKQNIIPVSLKAIDKAKNKSINDVRFIPDGSLSTEESPSNLISDVKIQLSKLVKDPIKSRYATNLTLKATCKNHSPIEVIFRNKGLTRNLLITAIDKSSKSQVGSAVNKLKAGLELGDSFLDKVDIKTLSEFEHKVQSLADATFEIPNELKKQIAELKDEKLKKSWIDRTAYKAFIAVLEGYSNKFENGHKVDIKKFFKYIYDLAAGKDSKSIWWLVK